jgi:hypothetical protein
MNNKKIEPICLKTVLDDYNEKNNCDLIRDEIDKEIINKLKKVQENKQQKIKWYKKYD